MIDRDELSVNIPSDKNMLWFGAEMSALFVVGGTMGSWLVSNLIPLAICSAAAVIIGGLVLLHEIIRRPTHARIADDIQLSFRTRDPLSIPLESIEWVDSSPGDPKTRAGRINRGGKMKIKGRKYPIPLGYEAAEAVRQAYAGKKGVYPPSHPRLAGNTSPLTKE